LNKTHKQDPLNKTKRGCAADPALLQWCSWWNGLHERHLVHSSVNVTLPSKAIVSAWTTARKTPELSGLLTDRARIEQQIVASDFCRGGWFRLEKLFRKNKDGEFILAKLLDGAYANGQSTKANRIGPGQVFDPATESLPVKGPF
jgi:hypothetical protein